MGTTGGCTIRDRRRERQEWGGQLVESGELGEISVRYLAPGQAGSEYAFLGMTRIGSGGLDVGPRFYLAPGSMEPDGIEIGENDSGAQKTRDHDCGAKTREHGSTHNQ
jgi:hypothetical protein